MDTVSLMGGDSDDDDGVEVIVAGERRWQGSWRMALPVFPKLLRRLGRRRSSSMMKKNNKNPHSRHGSHKQGATFGDHTTVAPSHSTNMSRLDDSYDSRDCYQHYQPQPQPPHGNHNNNNNSNKLSLLRRPRTSDARVRDEQDEEIVFDDKDEEASSFAQRSLNTISFAPAPTAYYLSPHSDGMEVILKNGVLSDATEYSWSPTPEDDDDAGGGCGGGGDNPGNLRPVKSALPVEEICFFPNDDHYSTLIDGDLGENMFSSFAGPALSIKDEEEAIAASSSSSAIRLIDRPPVRVETFINQQQQQQQLRLESSFHTLTSTSTRGTEHSNKPSAAMIKRLSAFSGQDLLRQEADLFAAQLLRLDDEKSKGTTKSKSSKKSRLLRSSESRLLAAIDAISDDEDTLSKERSSLIYHQNLMDNNSSDDDEEDTTISTVTNIFDPPPPRRSGHVTTAIAPRIANTSSYCGLFFSEPILTEADNDEDANGEDDDYSDLYSRPSTAESSKWRR